MYFQFILRMVNCSAPHGIFQLFCFWLNPSIFLLIRCNIGRASILCFLLEDASHEVLVLDLSLRVSQQHVLLKDVAASHAKMLSECILVGLFDGWNVKIGEFVNFLGGILCIREPRWQELL